MTMVWSLSPMLGFFLAPLMGSLSDRCTIKWGRRRPLLLILSVLIFTGLILVPWGKTIGTTIAALLGDTTYIDETALRRLTASSNQTLLPDDDGTTSQEPALPFHKWAAVVTIIGTICLDFSADTCQTPARTYMLDTCISEDHARGLSIFTVLAGFGGFMGYSLGGIDWESTFIGELIGSNVKTVFTIVTFLFVISCTITMLSFREIPLKLMEADELLRPLSRAIVKQELERNQTLFIIKEVIYNKSIKQMIVYITHFIIIMGLARSSRRRLLNWTRLSDKANRSTTITTWTATCIWRRSRRTTTLRMTTTRTTIR